MLLMSGILLISFGILFVITLSYKKEVCQDIDKKEHRLQILYPLAFFLIDKVGGKKLLAKQAGNKESLKALYVVKEVEKIQYIYYAKVVACSILCILCSSILSLCLLIGGQGEGLLKEGKYLIRPEQGEGEAEVELQVNIRSQTEEVMEEVVLEIDEREYTQEERKEVVLEVKDHLKQSILGENPSLQEITTPLQLVKQVLGIRIEWDVGSSGYINASGEVLNEEVMGGGVDIVLTAALTYKDYVEKYEIPIKILPKTYSMQEKMLNMLKESLETADEESQTSEVWELPEEVEGSKISYQQKEERTPEYLFGIGILLAAGLPFLMKSELEKRVRLRDREMIIDYPDVVNKFTLLLGAGMNLKGAWGKIVCEYIEKREKGMTKKRYAYEELLVTWNEMSNGVTERSAYESFGRRVKLLPYMKFSTLITQNMKKGNKGLLEMLELGALEAFEERKELVKRAGEEASSKLLVPMLMMFIIVLGIVMVPAIISL